MTAPRPRGEWSSVNTKSKDAEKIARRAVIDTALAMSRSGLSTGRSGNVSCRWKGGMLITPTGMAYEAIRPRDIVFVNAKGAVPGKRSRKPSSEWRFHLAAYRARPDIKAVVSSPDGEPAENSDSARMRHDASRFH